MRTSERRNLIIFRRTCFWMFHTTVRINDCFSPWNSSYQMLTIAWVLMKELWDDVSFIIKCRILSALLIGFVLKCKISKRIASLACAVKYIWVNSYFNTCVFTENNRLKSTSLQRKSWRVTERICCRKRRSWTSLFVIPHLEFQHFYNICLKIMLLIQL